MKPRRQFAPSVDRLEGRQLLSTVPPPPTPWVDTSSLQVSTSYDVQTSRWVDSAKFTPKITGVYVIDFTVVATVPTNKYYGYLSSYSFSVSGSDVLSPGNTFEIGDGTVTNSPENITSNVATGVNGGTTGYYLSGPYRPVDSPPLPPGEVYMTAGVQYTIQFSGDSSGIHDIAVSNLSVVKVS